MLEVKRIFNHHDVNFEDSVSLYNLTTNTVLPVDSAAQFLDHENEGQILYDRYKAGNICGSKSPWEKQKKRKLTTFASINKVVKGKVKDKIFALKEQSSLMTRLLITARKRPEVDLEQIIGKYELSVVPRSMFDNDGILLIDTTKSVTMHQTKAMMNDTYDESESIAEEPTEQKVIIFDGMGST